MGSSSPPISDGTFTRGTRSSLITSTRAGGAALSSSASSAVPSSSKRRALISANRTSMLLIANSVSTDAPLFSLYLRLGILYALQSFTQPARKLKIAPLIHSDYGALEKAALRETPKLSGVTSTKRRPRRRHLRHDHLARNDHPAETPGAVGRRLQVHAQ